MSKRDKLIKAMKNNPKDVPFEDIENLMIYYGCTVRQPGGGSSHYFFSHPAIANPISIPKDRPVKAVYVRRALSMLDEIKEALINEQDR